MGTLSVALSFNLRKSVVTQAHRRLGTNAEAKKEYWRHTCLEAPALARTNASSHTRLYGVKRLITSIEYTQSCKYTRLNHALRHNVWFHICDLHACTSVAYTFTCVRLPVNLRLFKLGWFLRGKAWSAWKTACVKDFPGNAPTHYSEGAY
jgi:hypothetical protein